MNNIQDKIQADQLDYSFPSYRDEFHIPRVNGKESIYFAGNSLGLQPKSLTNLINEELQTWQQDGVEAHTSPSLTDRPWVTIDETCIPAMARIVGAKENEIAIMNSLTANLHFLMISFYRPTKTRYKILIEGKAFPSDIYAIESQLKFHGYDKSALIQVEASSEGIIEEENINRILDNEGHSIALVLFGGVNYYNGQLFDMKSITEKAHSKGCTVGFDLAHAVGNVELDLHKWNVDFACWCSYKYLNSGPGGIAGIFVHEKHDNSQLPKLVGWWGNQKNSRFEMNPEFSPIKGAAGYQLSNPNVFATVSLLASLQIFEKAEMKALRLKSIAMGKYFYSLVSEMDKVDIITPNDPAKRGCQFSLKFEPERMQQVFKFLKNNGVICDERKPNVIRVAPVPLYNTFNDILKFAGLLKKGIKLSL